MRVDSDRVAALRDLRYAGNGPHPTSLRSATFPQGKALGLCPLIAARGGVHPGWL